MSDGPIYRAPDVSLVGADHVRLYQETDGQEGYLWNGAPILLLTTTGRKSGLDRTQALIYGEDGDDFLVVASQGGSPKHPSWYLNLSADPRVSIQVRNRKMQADALTADDAERPRLWGIVTSVWPNYDVYVTRTTRKIPVVILRPVKDEAAS